MWAFGMLRVSAGHSWLLWCKVHGTSLSASANVGLCLTQSRPCAREITVLHRLTG